MFLVLDLLLEVECLVGNLVLGLMVLFLVLVFSVLFMVMEIMYCVMLGSV